MKNKIKQIEKNLRNYKSMIIALENLREEYELSQDTLQGVDTNKDNIQRSNMFHSDVEDAMIQLSELENKIKKTEFKIKRIDRGMQGLTQDERQIIWNYYIEGRRIYMFTGELGYSERTVKRFKAKALEKMVTMGC